MATMKDVNRLIAESIYENGVKETAELEIIYVSEVDTYMEIPETPDELIAWQEAALAFYADDDEMKEVVEGITGTLAFAGRARAAARGMLKDGKK